MKLPNGDAAIVDIAKLRDYCLSPDHPRGKLDLELAHGDLTAVIRSSWIVRTGERIPRFVTCFVL
jgi:hypothetical protein